MTELLNISPISASILVVLLPFMAFLIQAIRGKKSTSGIFSLVAIALSALLSGIFVFAEVWNNMPMHHTYDWFRIGDKTFTIGILLNNLTVLMLFIVSIVALPVHIYSRAYMKGDPGIHRYWMYLSLFCFAMLGLCISKNILVSYIFWELVGFASYLLIGFWFTKESAVQANKKAFLINRIGDLGFLIGIAAVFTTFGTLDLVDLFGKEGLVYSGFDNNTGLMTLAGLGFFLGAMAKSAQFPLHVWLPDAMEGPTSVSSLIHAATMVAAGVFLLCTLFPLFNDHVLLFITIIGTVTATLAAYFASGQYDIKRVLAFSTISQLGYMMAAVGIGAWDAALFHLATHAFFKCLLFLCAGAVIHEIAHAKDKSGLDFDPQDLRHMGGLRKYMPKTFVLMSIASLALAGFPLTSGFLSKDAIVIATFEWAMHKGGLYFIVPILLVLVSILTAFYIGRLIFKAFLGKSRLPEQVRPHLHEAPKQMLYPMYFLAICSLFFVFSWNPVSYHQAGILEGFSIDYIFKEIHSLHLFVPLILTITALISWVIGYNWYVLGKYPLDANSGWIKAETNQLGINKFINSTFVKATLVISKTSVWLDQYIVEGMVNSTSRGTLYLSNVASVLDRYLVDGFVRVIRYITLLLSQLAAWWDKHIVDGIVNTIAGTAYYLGHLLRWIQNGRIQNYLGFAFTVVLIGILYLILR
ncbi:NADH-quinone oxidoreductase subunit 5 family protein [Sphingobacterium faecale]|uniref:NADH-quinone oxidoreductase subunit L n=1 Tax=Sphingobacterium faecale TaxID=2803775 RepID=A0ABS1R0H2_9SPHI|nr:NADH-quinone oxidoreductase subunit L [Sphingobacterium faecale]MBL1407815.1 NADH-quinone oxidoreductase subunit L [Sphingobacterium faecale]